MRKQGYVPDDPLPYQQMEANSPQTTNSFRPYPQAPVIHQTYPQQASQPIQSQPAIRANKSHKAKRSVLLLIASILGVAYFVYLIVYFSGVSRSAVSELGEGMGQFAAAIAIRMVTPHIISVGVGALISIIAWWLSNKWLALTAAIIYIIAGALFLQYFFFALPSSLLAGISSFLMFRIEKDYR